MDELRRYLATGLDRLSDWFTPEQSSRGLARSSEADKAQIVYDAGIQAYDRKDYASARKYHEKFLAEWDTIASDGAIASAHWILGLVAENEQDYRKARHHAEIGWNLRDKHNLPGLRFSLAALCGTVSYYQGDVRTARARITYALEISRILGESSWTAAALNTLASIAFEAKNLDLFEDYIMKALEIYREIGDKSGEAWVLNNLGYFVLPSRQYVREKHYLAEALRMFTEMDIKEGISSVVHNLATIARYEGDLNTSLTRYRKALKFKRNGGSRISIASSLEGLSVVEVTLGRGDRAARMIGAASEWRQASDCPIDTHLYADYEWSVSSACAQIGKSAFVAECLRGREMSVEDAVDFALSSSD